MKTTTFTTAALGLAVVAALLTSCAASTTATSGSSLVPAAPASTTAPASTDAPVIETPAPVDPVAKAAADSGLTAEVYAEVTSRTADIDSSIADTDSFLAAIDALGVEYGKPVVIVAHYICPDAVTPAWGISGALFGGAPPRCGTGYAASREATLEKVEDRAAHEKSWTPDDYILVFTDTVG